MNQLRVVVLVVVGGILSFAHAQQQTPPGQKEKKKEEAAQDVITADYMIVQPDGERKMVYLAGNVVLRRGDTEVRADRILAWIPATEVIPEAQKVEELYAEGNILFRRGHKQIEAERVFNDFRQDRALVIHLRARGTDPVLGTGFQILAEKAREIARGEFEAEDVSITTCDYGIPHYDIVIRHARILGKTPKEGEEGIMGALAFQNWEVRGENISPRVYGIPFFFVPVVGFSTGIIADFPLRSLEFGRTSRFGYFGLATFGFGIKRGQIDRIVPWGEPDEKTEHLKWGEILLHADYRQIRGAATGLDFKWAWERYHGYIESYYLQDQGRADDNFDNQFEPLDRPQRGRIRLFHRQDLSEHWRLEVEGSYISDRDLLQEFFPKEFWEGKEQEDALYVRWLDGNLGAYAYERNRINGFQTQVEYMPKLNFEMVEQPVAPSLVDRLVVTQSLQLAHLRLRPDEESVLSGDREWRLDSYNELALPLDLAYAQVAPFAAFRATVYEQDLENEREFRTIATVGARLHTEIYGIHDISWEAIGLRRIRHILELEARVTDNIYSSVSPDELFYFDSVDRLDQSEEVTFLLRNRFQTKVVDPKDKNKFITWEFLDTQLRIEYFPNPDRDTVGFQETNFTPPFDWLFLSPQAPGAPLESRRWSNLYYEATLRPREFFAISFSGEYNPVDHQEEVRETAVGLNLAPGLVGAVSETYIKYVTNAYGAAINLTLADKWKFEVATQYDFQAGQFITQRFVVGRDFHDFILEAIFEDNFGRDDRRFYLAIVPKFLGPAPRAASLDARANNSPY